MLKNARTVSVLSLATALLGTTSLAQDIVILGGGSNGLSATAEVSTASSTLSLSSESVSHQTPSTFSVTAAPVEEALAPAGIQTGVSAPPTIAEGTSEPAAPTPVTPAPAVPVATPKASTPSSQIADALAANKTIRIYNIRFDFDKATLRPDSMQPIADIAAALHANPNIKIKIEGHTDGKGHDAYNLNLSQRRANAVVNALVSTHGIDRSRLKPVGKGEGHPVATNATDAGRALNRRVEINSI